MVQLEREFNYYREHQEELVRLYEGKFVVIHDNQVLGAFLTELDAIKEISPKYPLGSFLIQKCEIGNTSYTQMFHSRVSFA